MSKEQDMNKFLIFIFAVVGITRVTNAQPPNYDDLLLLYVDEQYEKLLKKAEKYTLNDKTKKDPIPYFYMAKGLYKISESELAAKPEYKKAFQNSIKYMGKGIQYDTRAGGDAREQFEDDILELKKSIRLMMDDDLSSGNYKSAKGWAKRYLRLSPNTPGANLIISAAAYHDKDNNTGREMFQKAKEVIDEMDGVANLDSHDYWLLKKGIMEYALALCPNSILKQQAVVALNMGKQWFEKEEDFMRVYNQCVNGVNTVVED